MGMETPHMGFFCPKSFSLSISSFNLFINFVIIELSKTWFKKIKLLNLIKSMTRVMGFVG